jgi:hypothetical protein
MRTAFPADRRSTMGMCEATKADDEEPVSVARLYLSMKASKIRYFDSDQMGVSVLSVSDASILSQSRAPTRSKAAIGTNGAS